MRGRWTGGGWSAGFVRGRGARTVLGLRTERRDTPDRGWVRFLRPGAARRLTQEVPLDPELFGEILAVLVVRLPTKTLADEFGGSFFLV